MKCKNGVSVSRLVVHAMDVKKQITNKEQSQFVRPGENCGEDLATQVHCISDKVSAPPSNFLEQKEKHSQSEKTR